MHLQALPAGNDCSADLLEEICVLRESIVQESEARLSPYRSRYPQGFPPGARNLADYLALRSHELRPLQERLVAAGLSSLGRGESRVRANLARIINMLDGNTENLPHADSNGYGPQQLENNAEILFGRRNSERHTRIMVTLPAQAAVHPELARRLLENGVDCMRINCAHDDQAVWQQMIGNIRLAEKSVGRQVRVFMDLAGHKIRTGSIRPGPAVIHLQVSRDVYGRVITPARVYLGSGPPPADSELQFLPIDASLCSQLRPGHLLHFRDTRNKHRTLKIRGRSGNGDWLAESDSGAWLQPGTRLVWKRPSKKKGKHVTSGEFHVGDFSGMPQLIRLFRGDQLLLRNDDEPGAASSSAAGSAGPAQIGCSHPEVVDLLKPGDSVWIDDGKLGGCVEKTCSRGVLLKITHAGPRGARIRSDKGINLPDTELPLPALTQQDLSDLDFVCAHADMVGLSFVRKLADVDVLRHELAARGRPDLPVVLKIETAAAVKNLPDLLLGSMGQQPLGVMIARGDLAVELGSVRMAEIQEEILWICEAAHVPVIWATQVLDTLARKGVIARPEITDAAMSVRAECVMLNKGEYITDAVTVLHNILTRMDAHQYKKVSRLRRLHW